MDSLKLVGSPGSPYTRKMLAYLRFRHIPYELMIPGDPKLENLPQAKVGLLPTFFLPGQDNKLEAVVDSTPLIRRFEASYSGREVIPTDPALGFLNYLIEDYADEWLTKAMFHYRWYYDADIKKAGGVLPIWQQLEASPEQLADLSNVFSERQISRLYVVGSNDVTAETIESSYLRFLDIFNDIIAANTFVLGQRPSSADFGIYAQLTQLAKFDPTPAQLCLDKAPRVFAWVDVVDDLSGRDCVEEAWLSREAAAQNCKPLLAEIARTYVPFLLANADAILAGEKDFETQIDGRTWQQPSFPYQLKCLKWIKDEFQALSQPDQDWIASLLSDTGCSALIA